MPDHDFSLPVVIGFRVRERQTSQLKTFAGASLTASKKIKQDTQALIYMLNSHWIRLNWNLISLLSSPNIHRHFVGAITQNFVGVDWMKLFRFGQPGDERPGLILNDGRKIDASDFGDDYDEAFFAGGGYERNDWFYWSWGSRFRDGREPSQCRFHGYRS
jgi:hypothetical protein